MSLLLLLTGASNLRPLAGTLAGQSATTGALTVRAPLAATVPTASTITGALSVSAAGALMGEIDATGTLTGSITVRRPLAGTITAQSVLLWQQGLSGGKFVLTSAKVIVAGTDISRFCTTVQVQLERGEIDVTPLGSSYRVFMDGPQTGSFTMDLFADPTVITPAFWSSLDTPVSVSVTPRNRPTARDNPTWTGDAIAVRKTPLTGGAGDAAKASVELHSIGAVAQIES